MSDTQQKSITKILEITLVNEQEGEIGQKDSVNSTPLTCNGNVEEPSQQSDSHTRNQM